MDNGGNKSHNVVNMTQHVSETGFTPLSQVEAYWEALRGTRLMPSRSEIDPRGIEQALEYAFIVERIAPGIARLRIAGSHLSDLMGMEVRGMPLTAFITPASRRQLSDTLEEVFETPATCTIMLHSEKGPGMPPLDARLILMPLKSDLGDVSRILGALVRLATWGAVHGALMLPRPRCARSCRISLCRCCAATGAQKPLPAPKPTVKVPGFAEAKGGFRTVTPRSDAPYLRLVKSDDS